MLSLILPTYNEAQNLPRVIPEIDAALRGIDYEIIIADDNSPDGTADVAEGLRAEFPSVRVLRRTGTRGLSPAVADGFRMAAGDVLTVMDADGQHDPALLPRMLEAVDAGADVVIGSRYVRGGSVGDWNPARKLLSVSGTFLTRLALGVTVHDPLSGFFAIRRGAALRALEGPPLEGFKILLDLLVRLHSPRIAEVPFQFRTRLHGESKLTFTVHLAVLNTILPLLVRRYGWIVFAVACLLLGVIFAARLWTIRLLYTDADVRKRTEQAVRIAADREGWLLSDIHLQTVHPTTARLQYRPHRRGIDPNHCYILDHDSTMLIPCS